MGSIFSEWKYSGLKKSGWNIKGSIIWKRVKTPWRTMNRTSKNSVQPFSTFAVSSPKMHFLPSNSVLLSSCFTKLMQCIEKILYAHQNWNCYFNSFVFSFIRFTHSPNVGHMPFNRGRPNDYAEKWQIIYCEIKKRSQLQI